MRIAALAAILLLATGCAASKDQTPPQAVNAAPAAPETVSAAPSKAGPPASGASMKTFIGWVEAGSSVATAKYGIAIREEDGTSTQLRNGDLSFVSPTGKIKCLTNFQDGQSGLICRVDLKDPPPRPDGGIGNWVGGWVDFGGSDLNVGSFHGDPGAFLRGSGPELPYGSRITVHDFSCRMDTTGMYCLAPDGNAGVKMSDAGIVAFGCLSERTDRLTGRAYAC
ncbi:hypothetical protein D5S18_00505 [Nocardia panacis]|uniref:Lipoprotein LppI n=1 Tax=Nocardia panacis TaxID=2340916 RepID=A0A3A4KIV9_9NOCA|nr:hypothetical protein [Nocardia panacis]RJO79800.1 hypothetical protein D5S18_00505 [Nocardia panacis]